MFKKSRSIQPGEQEMNKVLLLVHAFEGISTTTLIAFVILAAFALAGFAIFVIYSVVRGSQTR